MKEYEDVAKAISIGMKALAKFIETAADQLQEHIKTQPGNKEAQQSPQKKPEAKQTIKKETPERSEKSAPATEAEKAPEKKSPKPKAKAKVAKKTRSSKKKSKKPSDTEVVYLHIQAAQKAVHIDEIHMATGFDKKKLHNILHRLKKTGKIKNTEKAVYTAA